MTPSIWDRDTILDITVNVIPLGILAFFTVAFLVVDQFGWDSLYTPLQLALVVLPFVGLVILTYFSAKAIETDAEERGEDVEAIPGYKSRTKTPAVEGETDAEAAAIEGDEAAADEDDASDDDEAAADEDGDGAATDDAEDAQTAEST